MAAVNVVSSFKLSYLQSELLTLKGKVGTNGGVSSVHWIYYTS